MDSWTQIAVLVTMCYIQQPVTTMPTMGVYAQCLANVTECSGMEAGHFPVCTDCSKFIKCSNSISAVFSCPPGTVYDSTVGVCNFPQLTDCSHRTSPVVTTTTPMVTTTTPAVTTTPMVTTSLTTHVTSPVTAAAAAPATLPIFTQCVTGYQQCIDNSMAVGQYPSCSDCSKLIKCDGSSSYEMFCADTLLYDVNLGVCNFAEQTQCGTRTTTVSNDETTDDALAAFNQCVNDAAACMTNRLAVGQYPSCSDCTMFIKCGGEQGSGVFSCPSGLHYDVNLGVCQFAELAVCGTSSN